jgi:hypothetical protein
MMLAPFISHARAARQTRRRRTLALQRRQRRPRSCRPNVEFLEARALLSITLISTPDLSMPPVPADGSCYYPSLSTDGRYLAFGSSAGNLVPGDTNGVPDVFVRDLETGHHDAGQHR